MFVGGCVENIMRDLGRGLWDMCVRVWRVWGCRQVHTCERVYMCARMHLRIKDNLGCYSLGANHLVSETGFSWNLKHAS